MSLSLYVRGKTYQVDVDSRGNFLTDVADENGDKHRLSAETLKELEQKVTKATRTTSTKVAFKLKRLARAPKDGYGKRRYGYSYRSSDEDGPWSVIVVTVRGVNEHTHQLMVTWPDGSKSDDNEVGRYSSDKNLYFPLTMADEEILRRRTLIDETQEWFEKHSVNALDLAKKAVAKAMGDKS